MRIYLYFKRNPNTICQPLTTLTTPQVVAELGYTRQVVKKVLGVTPTTMRPPFGDIGTPSSLFFE
jgi:hypothetical protein